MSTSADPCSAGFPRLVWDQDQVPAELDGTDAALAAGIARARLAMEQLVVMIQQTGHASDCRRNTIELALTGLDEQLMLATRAVFTLPSQPLSLKPLQKR